MAVLEAVAAQQRQMKQMQESMNEMRIDLMRLQSKETATNDDTASIVIVEPPAGDKESADAKKVSPLAPKNQHAKKEAAPAPSTSSSQSGGNRLYSGAVQREPQAKTGSEGFQQQVKRPNKGTNSANGKSKKHASMGGTSDSGTLRAGPNTFQIQVTNVNSDLSDDDIKAYLSSKSVEPVKIEDKTSPGWETKRFLLTLPFDNFENVMSPEFWPKKIYFKRWFPAKAAKINPNV